VRPGLKRAYVVACFESRRPYREGSGKTLAFLLPIVVKLRSRDDAAGGPRALLLSPTKELAQQSFRILKLLCRGTTLR